MAKLGKHPSDESVAALYRLLVESVVDYAIFVLDPRGHVLSWNAGAERLKGYVADEIIGKHFTLFYTPPDLASGKPAQLLETAARDSHVEDEGWRLRKDGSRFWASVVITRLLDESGDLVGFAKVTRDLTARRQAEEAARRQTATEAAHAEAERRSDELAQLNHQLQEQALELEAQTEEAQNLAEELEQSNQVLQEALTAADKARTEAAEANRGKSDFLTVMSHELRTPLNAIGGYAELLELGVRGPVSAAQVEDLRRIQRSQRHLLSLINDVLNYARIERGALAYDIQPSLVADTVKAASLLIEPQRAVKELSLTVRLPEDRGQGPRYVMADAEKLQQILINLLSNAVKFTAAGGAIAVEVDDELDPVGRVVIRVSDTGPGIPADRIAAIFEPFVQLRRGLSDIREGTGLGLAISRDLARAMNGELTVESTVGVGSTFTLLLPNAGSEAPTVDLGGPR